MIGLPELLRRLRALCRRSAAEARLDEEVRFHLEMEAEKNAREGMPPDEARRAAVLRFGGVESHKESVRDARGFRWLDDFVSDARYAWRSLRRTPAFSSVAVAHARRRYRRDDSGVHRVRCGDGAAASLSGCRQARRGLRAEPRDAGDGGQHLVPRLSGLAPRRALVCRARGVQLGIVHAERSRGCGARQRGPHQCESPARSRRPATARPQFHPGGATVRPRPRDPARLRRVEAAIRRRCRRGRADDHSRRRAAHDRRRDASGVPVSVRRRGVEAARLDAARRRGVDAGTREPGAGRSRGPPAPGRLARRGSRGTGPRVGPAPAGVPGRQPRLGRAIRRVARRCLRHRGVGRLVALRRGRPGAARRLRQHGEPAPRPRRRA